VRHNNNAIGLQDLIYGLLFSLQAEGGSVRTIEYYRDKLRPLLVFAQSKCWSNSLSSLDAHRLREFLSWIATRADEYTIGNGTRRARRPKATTAWPYYRALRRLLNWAVEEGYLESSPLIPIHFKPPSAPPIEGYTIDELKRLLCPILISFE
jgi:integrase